MGGRKSKGAGPRLRAWRESRSIGIREAARELHVSHQNLANWESELQNPLEPYREAIEVWTGGDIKAGEWPVSEREERARMNAAKVRPLGADPNSPPPPKCCTYRKTGTD